MTTPTEDARKHRAYKDSLARAIARAHAEEAAMSVYFDGVAMFVRDSKAAPPSDARLVCIAERWDGHTVQLRFSGAYSEFIRVA